MIEGRKVNSAAQEWLDEYKTFPKSVQTMQDFYFWTDKKHGSKPYLGRFRDDNTIEWKTRHEIHQMALSVGTTLVQLGIPTGARIGVYSENQIEVFVSRIYHKIDQLSENFFILDDALQARNRLNLSSQESIVDIVVNYENQILNQQRKDFSIIHTRQDVSICHIIIFGNISDDRKEIAQHTTNQSQCRTDNSKYGPYPLPLAHSKTDKKADTDSHISYLITG